MKKKERIYIKKVIKERIGKAETQNLSEENLLKKKIKISFIKSYQLEKLENHQ